MKHGKIASLQVPRLFLCLYYSFYLTILCCTKDKIFAIHIFQRFHCTFGFCGHNSKTQFCNCLYSDYFAKLFNFQIDIQLYQILLNENSLTVVVLFSHLLKSKETFTQMQYYISICFIAYLLLTYNFNFRILYYFMPYTQFNKYFYYV